MARENLDLRKNGMWCWVVKPLTVEHIEWNKFDSRETH